MLVELTAKGRRLVEKAWREDMDVENAIVANLSRQERQELARLLARLAQVMEQESET
jgi:DNA-binding MarR family transcriptional regulator